MLAGFLATACAEESVVHVTVEARPGVREASRLAVTLTSGAKSVGRTFALDGKSFPLTFTITPEAPTGQLDIALRALTGADLESAVGSASVELTDERVDVTAVLEPSDFVINTSIAGSQWLATRPGRAARQVAAGSQGEALVVWLSDCAIASRCDVFARLIGPDGTPRVNQVTMTTDELIVNRSNEQSLVVAVARGGNAWFVVWETLTEIRGALVSDSGALIGAADTVVAPQQDGRIAFDPAVAALSDGRFVVAWRELRDGARTLRARFIGPDGQPVQNPVTGTPEDFELATTLGVDNPAVATSGNGLELAAVWRDDGNIYGLFMDEQGVFRTAQPVALSTYAGASISPPQALWVDGQVWLTWNVRTSSEPLLENGAHVVRRINPATGGRLGSDIVLTAATPDEVSTPTLARAATGVILAAWHGCGTGGDGSGCGVWAQPLNPTGLPIGQPVLANTTRQGDQFDPAAAAVGEAFLVVFTDGSQAFPDNDAAAVRGRLLYVADVPTDGRRGAHCGGPGEAGCRDGLACFIGSGEPLCHALCEPDGPAPQCPLGGVCTSAGDVAACIF